MIRPSWKNQGLSGKAENWTLNFVNSTSMTSISTLPLHYRPSVKFTYRWGSILAMLGSWDLLSTFLGSRFLGNLKSKPPPLPLHTLTPDPQRLPLPLLIHILTPMSLWPCTLQFLAPIQTSHQWATLKHCNGTHSYLLLNKCMTCDMSWYENFLNFKSWFWFSNKCFWKFP